MTPVRVKNGLRFSVLSPALFLLVDHPSLSIMRVPSCGGWFICYNDMRIHNRPFRSFDDAASLITKSKTKIK